MIDHPDEIEFIADGETLRGTRIRPAPLNPVVSVLSLHGAGDAIRQRVFYLAEAMLSLRAETFAFDFSGHGESTGTLRQSSLKRRVTQAQAALDTVQFSTPTILMGNSMGGYVAAALGASIKPAGLLLLCPALYDDAAFDVPFDERFSSILRTANSFERSSLPQRLKSFTGDVLLLIGENDDVIPPRVMQIYESSFDSARSFVSHQIPEAPHRLHLWAAKPENTAKLVEPIAALVSRVTAESS